MNLLDNAALATYRSTEDGERWAFNSMGVWLLSFSIILATLVLVFSILLLFTEKMPPKLVKTLRINEVKTKLRFDESLKMGPTGMDLTMSVAMLLLLVATGLSLTALNTRDDHLVQNIQQKYAIDDIKWSHESSALYSIKEKLEATVTKGDKPYRVTITQNPDTYEPTVLLTPEASTEATELLK
jgi:hypothetical protein